MKKSLSGQIRIHNKKVYKTKKRFFKEDERILARWEQIIQVQLADGTWIDLGENPLNIESVEYEES